MQPALGAHTRTLQIAVSDPEDGAAEQQEGEASILRLAGVLLFCCPNLVGIELLGFYGGFGETVRGSVLKLIEAGRPGVTRLALEDVCLDQSRLPRPRVEVLQPATLHIDVEPL